jgi:hypothetical protein
MIGRDSGPYAIPLGMYAGLEYRTKDFGLGFFAVVVGQVGQTSFRAALNLGQGRKGQGRSKIALEHRGFV